MTGKIEQNMQSSQHPHGPQFTDDGRCRWCREQMDTTAEIEALTSRVDEEREAKHKVMAEAFVLTRRNAELTAALGDAEDAWIDSDVHPRDAAGTCEHCDRIAAIFAALTPTESEAK